MFYASQPPDIEILSSHGEDCPICGAAGSNCAGEFDADTIVFVPTQPVNDPLATFTVAERIFSEEKVGSRTVRKLLYAKGARIRPEEARRLGLLNDIPVAT